MAQITSRDVLHEIDHQEFANYRALQAAVVTEFNKHVLDFPPGYTYQDVLDRGFENHWIEERKDNSYVIHTGLPIYENPDPQPVHAGR